MDSIFSTRALLQLTGTLPKTKRYWIAFSGGMDSHVLLTALAAIRHEIDVALDVVHVNHGISRAAGDWAEQCRVVSRNLGLEFHLLKVDAGYPERESPESWARKLRYQAFAKIIGSGEILLTAHHKDDQAETFLLQLLRGAGPKGLSAMPQLQKFAKGWHARPLLPFTRSQLVDYARESGLDWIEDESNREIKYDRNFLRHRITPVLKERWPNFSATISRSARHQADAVLLLNDLARLDLEQCLIQDSQTIDLHVIRQYAPSRQANLLRYWLHSMDLNIPQHKKMQHILIDVIHSRYDSTPCVAWQGCEVRRYRNHIVAQRPLLKSTDKVIQWQLDEACRLQLGTLTACLVTGRGIKKNRCVDNQVTVQFRNGGETIVPAGGKYHKKLKKFFQEAGIPPWWRDRIPLIYIHGELVAVAGFWIADTFKAHAGESAWEINWTGLEQVPVLK